MKKIWCIILLAFIPVWLTAQDSKWSFVASVSGGISEADNPYMKNYKDSKGQVGLDLSANIRYKIWLFYLSSGVGFQSFKSESGLVMTSPTIDYKGAKPQFSYSNIYVPVSFGFAYDNKWRVYPLMEAGVLVGFPVEMKDRVVIGNEVITTYSDNKTVVPSYFAQVGVGYAVSPRCSLEAKFRLSTSSNTSEYVSIAGDEYENTWLYLGGQVSFVVKL